MVKEEEHAPASLAVDAITYKVDSKQSKKQQIENVEKCRSCNENSDVIEGDTTVIKTKEFKLSAVDQRTGISGDSLLIVLLGMAGSVCLFVALYALRLYIRE